MSRRFKVRVLLGMEVFRNFVGFGYILDLMYFGDWEDFYIVFGGRDFMLGLG